MFLIKWLERCFRLSDFGKGAWIRQGSEALFSRNMRKNTCSLVGGLIGFDYSLQGGRRNTDPKLMWGMSAQSFPAVIGIVRGVGDVVHARVGQGDVADTPLVEVL